MGCDLIKGTLRCLGNQMKGSGKLKILFLILAVLMASIFTLGSFRPYGVSSSPDAEQVYKIAIQSNDISICDKVHLSSLGDVTGYEIREVCYEWYAKAHPDQNICPRISNNFRCV